MDEFEQLEHECNSNEPQSRQQQESPRQEPTNYRKAFNPKSNQNIQKRKKKLFDDSDSDSDHQQANDEEQ
jgi:hypothetical protein